MFNEYVQNGLHLTRISSLYRCNQVFEARAAKDKTRYEKDKKEYESTGGGKKGKKKKDESDEDEESDESD